MLQRVLTAIVIAAVFIAILLLLPVQVVAAVFVFVALAAAWEWSSFPRFTSPAARGLYVLAMALAIAGAWRWSEHIDGLHTILWVALAWWFAAFLWITLAPTVHNRVTAAISGFLILVPAAIALMHLYWMPLGPQLVLFLLVLVWAADIGAFFAGRSFGRLKLAPRVSPAKTWEGLIGGVVVSVIVAAAGVWWFGRPPLAFMSLCLAVVLISIVGDLTESMFKRFAGLKDSGRLFPGHGGVLDRFDSVTAAAPLFLLGLQWLESLP